MNFDWSGDVLSSSIFRGLHRFTVMSDGNGDTQFEQEEDYLGLLSGVAFLLMPILRFGLQQPENSTEKIKNP
jgi:hypothetical protein